MVDSILLEETVLSHYTPPTPLLRLLLIFVSFAFSFQFFSCLSSVFAEEVDDFGVTGFIQYLINCFPLHGIVFAN